MPWQEDMNFMFEWQEKYLTSEFLSREHKIHIFELMCNVFLLYRHTDDGVFDNNIIFLIFPKILQYLSEGHTKVAEHFQKFLKIAEDCWRRLKDVSIIHQQI